MDFLEKGKVTILDDCLAPDKYTYLTYTGHNPWAVAKFISGRMRAYFHLSATGTAHQRTNWDVVGENISFYSLWKATKAFSGFTTMDIHMKVIGKKAKATNQGTFTLQMHGTLTTKFEGWIYWLKPLWLIYSYLFYHRVRRRMIESCRNNILSFREEIKKHFNLETAESITRAVGGYG